MMEFLGDVLYDLKEFSDTRFEVVALFRMIVASICGGLIGLEREMKGRPAGLKTFSLVCIGATLAMITNEYISRNFGGSGDLARMAAQVISGIGFLGAGTIIVTGTNQVRGLTTAAALWVTAALGISIGAGFYFGAFGGVAVIFTSSMTCKMIDRMVMGPVSSCERRFTARRPGKPVIRWRPAAPGISHYRGSKPWRPSPQTPAVPPAARPLIRWRSGWR